MSSHIIREKMDIPGESIEEREKLRRAREKLMTVQKQNK